MGYSFSCDGEQAMSNNCEGDGIVEKGSRKMKISGRMGIGSRYQSYLGKEYIWQQGR